MSNYTQYPMINILLAWSIFIDTTEAEFSLYKERCKFKSSILPTKKIYETIITLLNHRNHPTKGVDDVEEDIRDDAFNDENMEMFDLDDENDF